MAETSGPFQLPPLPWDPAALDPVTAAHGHEICNRLAAQDHAADHPVKRATGQKLIFPTREHPGDVTKLVTAGLRFLHPLHKFVHVVDADT